MTIKEIKTIIKKNPTLNYDEMQRMAKQAGIDSHQFDLAWFELYPPIAPKGEKGNFDYIYIILLIAVTIFGFDLTAWRLVLKNGDPMFVQTMQNVSLFTSNILILHLAAKILGGRATLYKTTGISVLLSAFVFLAQTMKTMNPLMYIALLYAGIPFLLISIYIVMKAYDIGFLRTGALIILDVLLMALVVILTYGDTALQQLIN